MKDKIFIVPQNDLESVGIINMLKQNGYKEGVDLFITKQGWGASWDNLEPEIITAIRDKSTIYRTIEIVLDEDKTYRYEKFERNMTKEEYDKILNIPNMSNYTSYIGNRYKRVTIGKPVIMLPDFSHIYGVELKGKTACHNIDHHSYCDKDWETGEVLYQEDRTNSESSIEQVAKILNVGLTLDQKFIAENDKGFVEAMKEYGKSIFMSDEEISNRIKDIRMREHVILAEVQGITPEMEQQAEEAIKNAYMLDNGTMVVNLPHSKCTTVTDRIPEQEYNGGLLIVCGDGEIDYYGPSSKVKNLDLNFGGWTGDIGNKYTFWGNKDLDPKLVIDIITHDKSKENIELDFNINDSVHNKKGCINADPTELENNNNFGGAALDTLDKEKVTLITNDSTNKEIGE